jgi:hypothetical protein
MYVMEISMLDIEKIIVDVEHLIITCNTYLCPSLSTNKMQSSDMCLAGCTRQLAVGPSIFCVTVKMEMNPIVPLNSVFTRFKQRMPKWRSFQNENYHRETECQKALLFLRVTLCPYVFPKGAVNADL